MLGPVSQFVLKQVKHSLATKSVVVWYDEEEAYGSLIPHLSDVPNCTIITYNGSYYEMAHKAHKPFDNLTKANRAKGHSLLLYVPRPFAEATPIREFSRAGEPFELTLRVAAQKALQSRLPQAALEEILAKQHLRLADLDQMGDAEQPSLLQAIFKTSNEVDITRQYLAGAVTEHEIDSREALSELVHLCRAAFGIPESLPISSHVDLKETLWRHLLVSNLREGIRPQPMALTTVPEPTPDQYRRVEACLDALRQQSPPTYAQMTTKVAGETGAAKWAIDPAEVRAHESFAFLEEGALRLVGQLVTKQHDLAGAIALAERYRASFWVRRDEARVLQWRAAELALELCRLADEQAEAMKQATGLTPEEAVSLYADPVSGWWRFDAAQRRLEAHVAQMEEEFILEGLLHHARYRHERVLDEMAELFASALERRGFQLGEHLVQTDLFSQFVEPLLNKQERVAYLLVDALRFEMGRELHDTMTGTLAKEIQPVIATPPTITQVGMAALLPGAEKGVSLATDGSRLGLAVGEIPVIGSAARKDWFSSKTGGGWAADLTLDDLISSGERSLKSRLDKAQLVIVRSQEIDAQGEEDNRHTARQMMSAVLGSLRKAITRLAKLGFTHVVIAADHGYLFAEEYGDDRKMDPPVGAVVELHRRCWIGRHATPPPHTLHFRASDLGLGGDLELVVPRGLAIFKAKGGAISYFHGGLSLQELVVPVITAELLPKGKEKPSKASDILLKPLKDQVTTGIIFTELIFASAIEPTKCARVHALVKDQEVGSAMGAAYGFDDQTKEITLEAQKPNQVYLRLDEELEGTGTLTVQVMDPKTNLVLAQVSLPYDLS